MRKGILLWGVWCTSLGVGIYGMGLLSKGIAHHNLFQIMLSTSVLMGGFWLSGNVLAGAKKAFRLQKEQVSAKKHKKRLFSPSQR